MLWSERISCKGQDPYPHPVPPCEQCAPSVAWAPPSRAASSREGRCASPACALRGSAGGAARCERRPSLRLTSYCRAPLSAQQLPAPPSVPGDLTPSHSAYGARSRRSVYAPRRATRCLPLQRGVNVRRSAAPLSRSAVPFACSSSCAAGREPAGAAHSRRPRPCAGCSADRSTGCDTRAPRGRAAASDNASPARPAAVRTWRARSRGGRARSARERAGLRASSRGGAARSASPWSGGGAVYCSVPSRRRLARAQARRGRATACAFRCSPGSAAWDARGGEPTALGKLRRVGCAWALLTPSGSGAAPRRPERPSLRRPGFYASTRSRLSFAAG